MGLSFTSNDQACRLNYAKSADEGDVSRPPGPKPGGAYTRYRVMCSSAEIASCCSSWSIRTDTQQIDTKATACVVTPDCDVVTVAAKRSEGSRQVTVRITTTITLCTP
jgi:hypothetical protein